MVDIEGIGMGLTLILLTTSLFISAVAIAEPGESFGMNEALNEITIGDVNVTGVVTTFNENFEVFSNSSGLSQIPLGADVVIGIVVSIMNFFLLATFGWTAVIDLLFAWGTGPFIDAIGLMLKGFFGIIMLITIANFFGRIIRGLPFFGGN